MEMTPELFVAGAGLAVAVVAAVFANRASDAAEQSAHSAELSASSARQANDIELHKARLEIYKGQMHFRMAVLQAGVAIPQEVIFKFYDHVNLSEFYFPVAIFEEMREVAEAASDIRNRSLDWTQAMLEGAPGAREMRAALSPDYLALQTRCATLDNTLRELLRLDRSKESFASMAV